MISDLLGHKEAIAILRQGLERGSVPHAYLFLGPKGIGKRALACSLAQGLNCTAPSPPCGQCPDCQRIEGGKHPDVWIVGVEAGRREISIDQVRELERGASIHPYFGKARVFIIDGAEYLSLEGANALLKTLEEPPPTAFFILLAANPRPIPPTVRSRCHCMELRPLPTAEIASFIGQRFSLEEEKARLLARLSNGRPGWAVAAARDNTLLEERRRRLERGLAFASTSFGGRLALAGQMASLWGQDWQGVLEELEIWQMWWRDLLLLQGGVGEFISNLDYRETLHQWAQGYNLSQVKSALREIKFTAGALRANAHPRLALEALALSLPEPLK